MKVGLLRRWWRSHHLRMVAFKDSAYVSTLFVSHSYLSTYLLYTRTPRSQISVYLLIWQLHTSQFGMKQSYRHGMSTLYKKGGRFKIDISNMQWRKFNPCLWYCMFTFLLTSYNWIFNSEWWTQLYKIFSSKWSM